MADDSDKLKYKVGIEAEEHIPMDGVRDKIQDATESYDRELSRIMQDGKKPIDDIDKVTAKGYNPNDSIPDTGAKPASKASSIDRHSDNDLGKNNSEKSDAKPRSSDSGATASDNNPRESAPDVGKNYGKSAPKPATADATDYPPVNNGEEGAGGEKPVNKGDGVNPDQNGTDKKANGENKDSGLPPKEDDLKKGKKGEKDKKTDEDPENDGSKDDKKDQNPDSKKGEKNPEAPENLDKSKQSGGPDPSSGNGYGALKKPSQSGNADGTENARKNMEHSKRIQQGKHQEEGTKPKPKESSGSINEKNSPSIGTRIKNGFKSLFGGKGKTDNEVSDGSGSNKLADAGKNGFKKALNKAKQAILKFLAAHPWVAVIIAVIIIIYLILFITMIDDATKSGKNSGNRCTYTLNGVLSTGTVKLEGLQVELINCDATSSNYTVLETVDFEKYVVGVALAEVGYSPNNPEYFKTGIIAARNFALTRNSSMCPGNPDDCFFGYNPNTGIIRMRACEADQVYWDYEKDIYRQARGAISLYSPEINSGTIWKSALSPDTISEVQAIANEVKGRVLVDESGNVVHTGYVNTDQQEWSRLAQEGKTYEEILAAHYGGNMSGATCSSGNIDYGDYVLSSDSNTILHEPLDSFLEGQGTSLEAFNGLIAENVQKAGYGTRAGVVSAAVTLIAELGNNYGVKVPYYWGGGHYDGVVDGALGYWGSTQCHTYANGQSYNYCGLDCSGFVPWAIKNGGFNISQMLAGQFKDLPGAKRVNLSNSAVLEPGDLLESSGHIVLVVGIEESSGNYICAEASGNAAGVLFTRRPFNSSGYWGVKMDGYYETHQRSE